MVLVSHKIGIYSEPGKIKGVLLHDQFPFLYKSNTKNRITAINKKLPKNTFMFQRSISKKKIFVCDECRLIYMKYNIVIKTLQEFIHYSFR